MTLRLLPRPPFLFLVLLLPLTYLGLIILDALTAPTDARMTLMYPSWHDPSPALTPHLPSAYHQLYSVHHYRDHRPDPQPACRGPRVPILYVPGNAGSYRDARSIGG